MDVRVGLWRKLSAQELMLLNCGVGEDSWESLGLQGVPPVHPKRDQPWVFIGRTDVEAETPILSLATWCKELTHLKRPWCWERLRAGEQGDDKGWDGWMASPTQRTWVLVKSRSCWWTWRPGVLWFMGLQRVRLDWATELNWMRTWKQPRCASTDEWIKKLWYAYTMDYYSVIKRNEFELVLMR